MTEPSEQQELPTIRAFLRRLELGTPAEQRQLLANLRNVGVEEMADLVASLRLLGDRGLNALLAAAKAPPLKRQVVDAVWWRIKSSPRLGPWLFAREPSYQPYAELTPTLAAWRSDFPDWEAPAPAGWWRVVHRGCAWGPSQAFPHQRSGAHCTNKLLAAESIFTCEMGRRHLCLRDEDMFLPLEGTSLGVGVLVVPLPSGSSPPSLKDRAAHEAAVRAVLRAKEETWPVAYRMVQGDPEAVQLCFGTPGDESFLTVDFIATSLASFQVVSNDTLVGCSTAPFASEYACSLLGLWRVQRLLSEGFVVLDGVLPEGALDAVLAEVRDLEENGCLRSPAQPTVGQRSDRIYWVPDVPFLEQGPSLKAGRPAYDRTEKWAISAVTGLLKGLADALNPPLSWRHAELRSAGAAPHQAPCAPPASDEAVLTVAPNAMLALYPAGTHGYIPHQDNWWRAAHGNHANPRELTAVLYLNPPDWDAERDGGELRLYPGTEDLEKFPKEEQAAREEDAVAVVPLGGRVVIFFSALWHQVMPARRDRRAITLWIFRPCVEARHGESAPARWPCF